jgi:hypothetical protein
MLAAVCFQVDAAFAITRVRQPGRACVEGTRGAQNGPYSQRAADLPRLNGFCMLSPFGCAWRLDDPGGQSAPLLNPRRKITTMHVQARCTCVGISRIAQFADKCNMHEYSAGISMQDLQVRCAVGCESLTEGDFGSRTLYNARDRLSQFNLERGANRLVTAYADTTARPASPWRRRP